MPLGNVEQLATTIVFDKSVMNNKLEQIPEARKIKKVLQNDL